jgi:RND family efflux transporter MFP subunit
MRLLMTAAAAALLPAAAFAATEHDCMIEPVQTLELRSPVAGLLQEVHTRRGATVRRGQLLVSIESSVEKSAADSAAYRAQAQGAIQTARHKVAAAQEKSRRLSELAKEELVSAQARDDAAAELRLAEAELKSAEEAAELARLEHRERVDALMDQYLHPGALVDGGEGKKPILKLAQTHPLAVQAILPFKLFPQLKVGMPVTVLPEAPFGGEIKATLRTVDRVIDPAAGTVGVVAELDNRDQKLPAGIRCRLRF